MAKQLKMNLQFTADNKKVLQSIHEVQDALSHISSGNLLGSSGLQLNRDLQSAVSSATELQAILDSAMNADTGNLDLTKFSQQLKASGKDLSHYRDQLYQLGPVGEQAFVKLTNAITLAEMPLRRTNKWITNLWTTMKNTARWQLTSSMLHGFVGAVQTAYGYTQDLNESLNNIRIVSGKSTEQMADFAKEANKAAKNLSTTTLDYTDAALIYYQQGLTEQEVKNRTDVTVKLANVSRQSAEDVSNQLTAIWNNFYDGSESLEHYANVLTALGAATASSTEEIAGGLEKFAAVANTIGLSYEYAAAALATITANTRESEEVVGTALKTIFARIQGLKLGETLDDGTTLNKYSQALQNVGISILDTQGNLKTMDVLLEEMGEKWNDLSSAQQTALAQTVAGTRQYNQLIALMSNWDSGDTDSFKANLQTAQNSTGALQEQADIYAESWEAARNRVRASAENIYTAILDDEFFIDLTNRFADLLDTVKLFIDSLGGIKGVLYAIGNIFTLVFQKQISQSLSNAAFTLRNMLPGGKERERKAKEEANALLIQGTKDLDLPGSGYRAGTYEAISKNQIKYIEHAKAMSEAELKINQQHMDRIKLLGEEVVAQSQLLDAAKGKEAIEGKKLRRSAENAAKNLHNKSHGGIKATEGLGKKQTAYRQDKTAETMATALADKTIELDATSGMENFEVVREHIAATVTELAQLDTLLADGSAENAAAKNAEIVEQNITKLSKTFRISKADAAKLWNELQNSKSAEDLATTFDDIADAAGKKATQSLTQLKSALTNCTHSSEEADRLLEDWLATVKELGPESVEAAEKLAHLNRMVDQHNKKMDEAAVKPIPLSEAITKAAGAMMSLQQAYSTVIGIIDVFNDENATAGDKIMSVVMGIGMLIPAIMSIAPAFSTASVGAKIFGMKAVEAGTAASLAMWQVTLIVAAITAIIAAIAYLATKESAAEKKAKEAAETASQFKEEAEAAAESLEKIKNAFDAYDTAVEKLNNCVKGTEEWNEALKEVNATVLNILQDVPALAKEADLFTRNLNTGMLEINENKRDEVLEKAEQWANLAQATAILSQASSARTNVDLQKDNLKKDIKTQAYTYQVKDAYGLQSTYTGAINLQSILTDNAEELADLTESEYRQKVEQLIADSLFYLDDTINDVDEIAQDLADEAMIYKNSVQSLGENSVAAANQMRTAMQILADSVLGDEVGAAEKTIAAAKSSTYQEEREDIWYAKMTGSGISKASGADNDIYQEVAAALAKATNNEYTAATGNTVLGIDSNREFVFSQDGADVEKSARWVAQQIAAAEALEHLENSAQDAATTLAQMDERLDNAGASEAASTVLRGFIANQNFDGHTMGEFKQFIQDVGGTDGKATQEEATSYVHQIFGENGTLTDEMAKNYGFDTAQALIDSFYKELNTMGNSWAAIQLPADLIGTSELEIETANKLNNIFKNINLGPAGEAVAATFTDGINSMIKDLDPTDQTKALGQLANIDWTSWDALEQADAIMKGFGVNIDTSATKWQNFAHEMRIAMRALPDFKTLKQTLIDIANVTEDLNFGDLIDDEDYQKLIAYNDEWERFFIMQANGQRQFIGDAKDMATSTRDQIRARQADLRSRKAAADVINANSKVDLSTITALSLDKEYGDGKDGKLSDTNEHVLAAGYTGAGAGERFLNDTLANRFQALLDDETSGQSIKDALAIGGYDAKTIETILAETRAGNHDRQNAMVQYLRDYLKYDYNIEASDLNEMLASTANSMAELEEMRAEIGEDAYTKQATALNQMYDETRIAEAYHKEDQILESIEHRLEKIASLKERANGKEQLQLLEDETKLLEQQATVLNTKINGMKQNQTAKQTELSSKYGVIFDENGTITNYEEVMYNNIGNWDTVSAELETYETNLDKLNQAELDLIDTQSDLQNIALSSLETMSSELSKYTEKMQHQNNVLEHYKNLSVLIGKETDYKALNVILSGQADIAKNTLEISKESAKFYADEAKSLKEKMENAVDNEALFAMYRQQWEAAEAKARETEETMLSDLQAWAEAEKAVLENTLADLGKTLEESLTGGVSFAELTQSMERASSLQEEYLTTTNQIYETTKMMRTAQQEMDTITNSVAKEKLKNFITETKQLQEQGKLSKFELETQQAKYDLLVAEIALEEARNAKNTVRLQRDSEGNFGYVYTADAAAVSEAQQKFDDAQNALYNKGLDGANDYAQKYQTTMSEMYDAFSQIQQDRLTGAYTTEEEYNNAIAEAKEYYYQKLTDYSKQYSFAVGIDSNVANDAWSTSFSGMIDVSGAWQEKVSDYLNKSGVAFNDWATVVATIEQTTGADLSSLATKVKSVTDESNALISALTGEDGLVAQLKTGFQGVATAITEAAKQFANFDFSVNVDSNAAAESMEGAATGGLTSNWGPEGKMLMVHENELILNADQTNKFFNNLAIMESILSAIDSYATGQQLGGILSSPAYSGDNSGTLEQNVKIEASFPGVTDRNEIEEAFNNLVNKASQYANRK